MTAVDTNILVRLFVRDDSRQTELATALIRDEEIWVAKTVLLETEWVLRRLYRFSPASLAEALRSLAGMRNVFMEDDVAVAKALEWLRDGVDFADALHLASVGDSNRFATFDRKLAQRAKRLTLETIAL